MENPGECSVCFITYDESEHRPRTLPCGHTFCSPCLGDMEGGQLSCPTCRACHPATSVTQFPINYCVEALVKQLKAMQQTHTSTRQESPGGTPPSPTTREAARATLQKQFPEISRKLRSLLEEQKNSVSGVVMSNQELQSQLDQYRAQLAAWKMQHLHLIDRLHGLVEQNKAALVLLEQEDIRVLDMKEGGVEGEKQLEAVLGCLSAVSMAQEVGPTINLADHCMMVAVDWLQKCQELFPDVTTVTTSMKVNEVTRAVLEMITEIGDVTRTALKTRTGEAAATEVTRKTLETEAVTTGATNAVFHLVDPTSSIMEKIQDILVPRDIEMKDLRKMRLPVKELVEAGHVFGVQKDEGGLSSSKITLENGQLYLHCLLKRPPPLQARTLPVSEVVRVLNPSYTLAFLDLSWPGSKGRVHIRLSPDTSLARQFVLLCTGQRGHSYLNTTFLMVDSKGEPGEFVRGGDYQYNSGKGGAPLLPHPEEEEYRSSFKAGTVCSILHELDHPQSTQFDITTRKCDFAEFCNIFGEVESGLEVVRAAVNHGDIKQVTVVDCGVVVHL